MKDVDLYLNRDSPDNSQTSFNINAFPASLEHRCGVRMATGTSGSPNGGRGVDLAIFLGIGMLLNV
jgi:hypothetical protein